MPNDNKSKYWMSRSVAEQMQSVQKDSVISGLKKELYELKDKEHEFIPLENQVANIESKYDMLLDEKERIESEHKIKLEINRKNILQLRTEIDGVRMQMHRTSVQIQEVQRELANLKRSCENRQNQIAALLANSHDLNSKNQSVNQENRNQSMKIKNHKEERNVLEFQNERLLKALEDNVELLKGLEKDQRGYETTNVKLTSILSQAEKDNLIDQMKSRDDIVNATIKKLEALNVEIEGLREKAKKLEKECAQSELEFVEVTKDLAMMVSQNKEQAKKIKVFENQQRLLQNDFDNAILERDALYTQHQELSTDNKILNEEIDRVLMEIMDAERMNAELQKQLDNYRIIDQEARKLLNRGTKMEETLVTTNDRLQITGQNIEHLR